MSKAKRQAISAKLRFAVLHRDGFQCVYCGASAPDTVLQIDHRKPVALGGDNGLKNLVTACQACNAGKSANRLNYHIDDQRIYAVAVLSHFWAERRFGLDYVDDPDGFALIFYACMAANDPNSVTRSIAQTESWRQAKIILHSEGSGIAGALERRRLEIGSCPVPVIHAEEIQ